MTPAAADAIRLVALGDSLTAGYGLSSQSLAFPARLEAALRERGYDVVIANAGVSGDTASAGLARLSWALGDGEVDGVILELGANDMLRGLDPSTTEAALTGILDELQRRDIAVLIAGMYAAPNLGEAYGARFNAIFPDLAESYGADLYPFFLDGVAGEASLNLDDGIHPTPEGVDVIVERILPTVEAFLDRIATDEG